MEGWIKLHRKFISWEWFDDPNMIKLFIYLLLSANHKDDNWRGINVTRGQLITGLNSLSVKTKISIQTLRTCLTRLEMSGEIKSVSTNKYRIITVCEYDSYQTENESTNSQDNNQLTSNQQSTNNQLTADKKEENEKNEKNLLNRKEKFEFEVNGFSSNYADDMLEGFINYWTEKNKRETKMRFEMEKTWETSRRLATWSKRSFNSQSTKPQKDTDY